MESHDKQPETDPDRKQDRCSSDKTLGTETQGKSKSIERAFHTSLPYCQTLTGYEPVTAPPLSTLEDGHTYKVVRWCPPKLLLNLGRARYAAVTGYDSNFAARQMPTFEMLDMATDKHVRMMTERNLIPSLEVMLWGAWPMGRLCGCFKHGYWGEPLYVWTVHLYNKVTVDVAALVFKPPNMIRGADFFGAIGEEQHCGWFRPSGPGLTADGHVLTQGLRDNAVPFTQQARKYASELGLCDVALFDYEHLLLLDLEDEANQYERRLGPGRDAPIPDLLTATLFQERYSDTGSGECFHMILLGFVLRALDRTPSLLRRKLAARNRYDDRTPRSWDQDYDRIPRPPNRDNDRTPRPLDRDDDKTPRPLNRDESRTPRPHS
ncbi:uncharacterized protein BO97DRAFT_425862 [Aspergillus homomorphus CBS 101889]|uniref:Uncharacterized protein n=1 Tax=Aspergillus homomorphus (strain CBS 101889) TaxID=1450537 RepID=A0A395HWL6_ASPHC|nr:hypothetical protein BO97DRAFT_425862 [Aspergillus homomorphus CBS 101889]RAL11238.1 hypothetical protein BO97DRAFT_425862 [Aspergillus homomorphus CBS 101889]